MVQLLWAADVRALLSQGVIATARALATLCVMLALFAGCAELSSPVSPTIGPAGESGWLQIRCPKGGVRECRQLASKTCPRGYEVADRRWDSSAYTAVSGLDEASGAPGEDGSMLVVCK